MVDEIYLDNLQEYVYDEGRVVTFKWLSATLDVHVNVAKQMLWHFAETRKQVDLTVTYIIAGETVDPVTNSPLIKIQLVNGNNLESQKTKLNKLFSVHVYSVQKGPLKDSSSIFIANKEAESRDASRQRVISSDSIKVLSPELLLQRRLKVMTTLTSAAKPANPLRASKEAAKKPELNVQEKKPAPSNGKSSASSKSSASVASMFGKASTSKAEVKPAAKDDAAAKNGNEVDAKREKREEKPKQTATKSKPLSVASMFSKQKKADKTEETEASKQTENQPVKTEIKKEAKSSPKNNAIGAMFAKQAAKPKPVTKREEEDEEEVEESGGEKKTPEDQEKEEKLKKEKEEKEKKKDQQNKEKKEQQNKGKKDQQNKDKREKEKRKLCVEDDEPKKNKRRRLKMMSESSDEDEPMAVDPDEGSREDAVKEENQEMGKKENQDPSQDPAEKTQTHVDVSDDDDVIPATPPVTAGKIRKTIRVRKQKDKTYIDDEGNFVTEKVMESEEEEVEEDETNHGTERLSSVKKMFQNKIEKAEKVQKQKEEKEKVKLAEEGEEDDGKKKAKKSTSKKKKNSPAIGKQLTLTNFFKKK